jgi:hypothetical protein
VNHGHHVNQRHHSRHRQTANYEVRRECHGRFLFRHCHEYRVARAYDTGYTRHHGSSYRGHLSYDAQQRAA